MKKVVTIGLILCSTHALAHRDFQEHSAVWAAASMTYHNKSSADDEERWRIPGVLMGGDAMPTQKGMQIDDAMLGGQYAINDLTKVVGKLSVHGSSGSHASVNLGALYFQHKPVFLSGLTGRIGLMSANFSPSASFHSSMAHFSEAPLIADAFWGRTFHDTGISLTWRPHSNLILGGQVWDGSSFPASAGQGSQNMYAKLNVSFKSWTLHSGVWAMQAQSDERGDARYQEAGGHTHGGEALTEDILFTGDSVLRGIWFDLQTPKWSGFQLSILGEVVSEQSDGKVLTNETLPAAYETDHLGYYLTTHLHWRAHQLSYRVETLSFENKMIGSTATKLAQEEIGNLLTRDNPSRQTVQWKWQTSPEFAWRVSVIRDHTLTEVLNRFSIGLTWKAALYRSAVH